MTNNKPLFVGAFVCGGLVLGVATILVFGGMHLFTHTVRIVGVFEGSVAGLNVGSPVTFRGVNIGKVQSMQVEVDVFNKTGIIPVYMELEPNKIAWTHGHFRKDTKGFEEAVNAGLRAQLRSDSLVTGQLSVDLDFHPGVAGLLTSLSGKESQIPTMPSDMQNLKDEVRELNLRELSEKTLGTLASMQRFLDTANDKIGPLADSLGGLLSTARTALSVVEANSVRTFDNVDKLAVEGRGQLATNGRDLDRLLQTAQATVTKADALLTSLDGLTAERSPLRVDLEASVRDLAASAGSLRTFTREFERDPARTLLKKGPR